MPLSHSTLSSSPDLDGHCYWTSFDHKSFARGEHMKAYVGKMNGQGPRCGELSVVKIFLEEVGTESLCDAVIRRSRKARQMAGHFNNFCSLKRQNQLRFVRVLKANMDEVSFMHVLGNSNKRHLRKDEWVLIEENIGKHLRMFIEQDGHVVAEQDIATILEAFIHYSYHFSGGELVISNLEGVKNCSGFCLKTPAIHSQGRRYGFSDQGESGIAHVFQNHKCNDLCKDLLLPPAFQNDYQRDPPKYTPFVEPSAPYDPAFLMMFTMDDLDAYHIPSPPPYCLHSSHPFFDFHFRQEMEQQKDNLQVPSYSGIL